MRRVLFTSTGGLWGLVILLSIAAITTLDCYLFYSRVNDVYLNKNETNYTKTFTDYMWPSIEFTLFVWVGSIISVLICGLCLCCMVIATHTCWGKKELLVSMAKKAVAAGAGGQFGIPCECCCAMLFFWLCGQTCFLVYSIICIICAICLLPSVLLAAFVAVLMFAYEEEQPPELPSDEILELNTG